MNRKEYVNNINGILEYIRNNHFEKAEIELRKLDAVYPHTLGYYVCKEKLQFDKSREFYNPYLGLGNKVAYVDDYPFINEMIKLYRDAAKRLNSKWIEDHYMELYGVLCNDKDVYNEIDELCRKDETQQNDILICKELYGLFDACAYVIHRKALEKKYPELKGLKNPKEMYSGSNFGTFIHNMELQKPIILLESETYSSILKRLLKDLSYLDIPVYYITTPNFIEQNKLEDSWNITLESIKKKEKVTYITPVIVNLEGELYANNIDDVINYVKDELIQSDLVGILGEMHFLEEISIMPALQKKFYKITTGMMSRSYRCANYALYGDYLAYISDIYNENIKELIHKPAEVMFSIIIPARNSSSTLRYTIKTCLAQTYQGEYEIIISDNSTDGNADVYSLYKELNDERIVYLRTPRELHLPKSFEFAYTHARGKYILGLGSDDGLLPWALEKLNAVIEKHPEENIIQWERGFYAWPGFNGGQENQFEIPRKYDKDKVDTYYKSGIDYLAEVMSNSQLMYGLPMLYINSCFKREYFDVLIAKTGRLWDGVCQDIYIGIVNSIINPQILNIKFPLTIAGMSTGSVGAQANKTISTEKEINKVLAQRKQDGNIGGYYDTYYEQLCPSIDTDTHSLYKMILRTISIGLLPSSYIDEVIPWKEWYIQLAAELDIKDITFDAKINKMRYSASLLGKNFEEWFNKGIFEIKTRPRYLEEDKKMQEKTYEEGKNESERITLDASKYNVNNIYDATQLFVKIMENNNFLKK